MVKYIIFVNYLYLVHNKIEMKACNLFAKSSTEKKLPYDMDEAAKKLLGLDSQIDVARAAYDIVSTKFQGGRVNTFLRLSQLFSKSTDELWHRKGFMHCTNQNFLLANFLVYSGKFSDAEVEMKWTNIWLTPHQYVRLKLKDGGTVDVDCWARWYGVTYGSHASFFNTSPTRLFAK